MKSILLDNILPFWAKNGVDREFGGMLTNLDRNGQVYGTDKNLWFAGRSMYTYALVYNQLDKNPEYLEICENMLGFLKKCELNERGRLPFIVSRDGKPIVKREAYYSETFAAIGCAEYYLATRREDIHEKAEQYFDIAYEIYQSELNVKFDPNAPIPQTKALGPSMIMLSTAQTMRKLDNGKYHPIAEKCADEIIKHFFRKKDFSKMLV